MNKTITMNNVLGLLGKGKSSVPSTERQTANPSDKHPHTLTSSQTVWIVNTLTKSVTA